MVEGPRKETPLEVECLGSSDPASKYGGGKTLTSMLDISSSGGEGSSVGS